VVDEQGTEHPSEMIIGAVHPDIILRLTGDHGFRPSWRQHVRATSDGAGAFLLAMKLVRPAHELGPQHHFLRLADGSDAYVVASDCWSAGSSLAGSLSARRRPGPYHLEAMMWLPVGDTAAWTESTLGRRGSACSACSAWKQARAAYLLAALEERFPKLRAEVLANWTASPLTFRDYLGGRAGGAMGLSHDLGHLGSQTLPGRSKIHNLLFTGQNYAHPGILGCLISAYTVAGAVLQRDLRQEILSA
jgi:all-trans-retinol 13,14-reductase